MNAKKPINHITEDDILSFELDGENGRTLDRYQYISQKSAIYPGQGSHAGLIYTALKLNGEAGEFAEHVGKAMRDDDLGQYNMDADVYLPLTEERRELLILELGDQLWYIAAACRELGTSMSDAALKNLLKLKKRSEEGKLQGSGDKR